MNEDLHDILSRVARLGELSEAEARRVFSDVFEDGFVSRGEVEALFLMNDTLSNADPFWDERFVAAIKDFLLAQEAPEGWITDEESDWLIDQIERQDGAPNPNEIELILTLLRYAQSAPKKLSRFALTAISQAIKTIGYADSVTVEQMRRVLYAPAGQSSLWVNQLEATILFETNDAVAFAKNDPAWNDLFARAIGNHLMARAHPSPGSQTDALAREAWLADTSTNPGQLLKAMTGAFSDDSWFEKIAFNPRKAQQARQRANEVAIREAETVTTDENAWFMKRLGWDQSISPAERSLIEFLKIEAPGFADGLALAA